MTDTMTSDLYPSRVAPEPSVTPRLDPVVHRRDGGPALLSEDEVSFFEENGYLFLENVFSPDEMDACRRELAELSRRPEVRESPRSIIEPTNDEVRSVFEVHRISEVFADVGADARVADRARQLLGSDVYIHQSRVNLKPALRGKEFYWHSDFETWHVEDGMPRMRAVSCSIALTANTEFNGPLMVVPGSHKWYVACVGETPDRHYEQSLRRQEYGVPDHASLQQLVDEGGIVAPKGAPGSIVLFDCNMMHASGVNLSPYPRSNAFFVYNSVENIPVAPFSGQPPRPEHIASRDYAPLD